MIDNATLVLWAVRCTFLPVETCGLHRRSSFTVPIPRIHVGNPRSLFTWRRPPSLALRTERQLLYSSHGNAAQAGVSQSLVRETIMAVLFLAEKHGQQQDGGPLRVALRGYQARNNWTSRNNRRAKASRLCITCAESPLLGLPFN